MRAEYKDATDAENPGDNDRPYGHLPISHEGSLSIEKLAEEEQERHLNGEDSNPAHNPLGKSKPLGFKNTVYEVRRSGFLQHVFGRAQDQTHGNIYILEHNHDEREGSDQQGTAEQQDVVVCEEAVLVTKSHNEPAEGRKDCCGDEHRSDRLMCFSIVHTLTV